MLNGIPNPQRLLNQNKDTTFRRCADNQSEMQYKIDFFLPLSHVPDTTISGTIELPHCFTPEPIDCLDSIKITHSVDNETCCVTITIENPYCELLEVTSHLSMGKTWTFDSFFLPMGSSHQVRICEDDLTYPQFYHTFVIYGQTDTIYINDTFDIASCAKFDYKNCCEKSPKDNIPMK